ncbi:hypothetical protein ABT330_06500 [Streptomyces sp. NPDC000658]|uniref:hypothetical protein n=1 Tax=Streptomyces sp. NPDC000658 TaxID=3154266 RepID=UPI0033313A46
MSSGSDADGIRQGAVPGPRGAELPLPSAALPDGSHDGDIADGLEEAYWSVYDGGRVTESGTHQELMDRGGEYAAMFTLQSDGYRAKAGEAGTPS